MFKQLIDEADMIKGRRLTGSQHSRSRHDVNGVSWACQDSSIKDESSVKDETGSVSVATSDDSRLKNGGCRMVDASDNGAVSRLPSFSFWSSSSGRS